MLDLEFKQNLWLQHLSSPNGSTEKEAVSFLFSKNLRADLAFLLSPSTHKNQSLLIPLFMFDEGHRVNDIDSGSNGPITTDINWKQPHR